MRRLTIVCALLLALTFPAATLAQSSEDDFMVETELEELTLTVEDGGDFEVLDGDLFVGYHAKDGEAVDKTKTDVVERVAESGIDTEYVYSAELERPGDEFRTVVSLRTLTFDDVDDAEVYPESILDDMIDNDTDFHLNVDEVDEDELPLFDGFVLGIEGDAEYEGGDTAPFLRYVAQRGHVVATVAVYSEDAGEVQYIIGELFDAQWDCIEADEPCDPIPFPDPAEAFTGGHVAAIRPVIA
jgi:hypothetical protein